MELKGRFCVCVCVMMSDINADESVCAMVWHTGAAFNGFPNSYDLIKSFMLLKIKNKNLSSFLICLGSSNKNKFSKSQNTELISFLIKVCESKINSFNLN